MTAKKSKAELMVEELALPSWPDREPTALRLAKSISVQKAEVYGLCAAIDQMPCRNEGERANLIGQIAEVKAVRARIEKTKRDEGGPFRKIAEAISGFLNPLIERLQRAEEEAKDRITTWQRAEQKRRDELLEKQRQVEQSAAASGAIVKPRPAPADLERHVVSSGVSSTTTTRWVLTITDPDLVPREFCVPDDKLIRARMNSDVKILGKPRDIPGVQFEQVDNLAIGGVR